MPELNIIEIPNGVDMDYFSPTAAAQQPNSLVFAGNLSWYPNATAMLYLADLFGHCCAMPCRAVS